MDYGNLFDYGSPSTLFDIGGPGFGGGNPDINPGGNIDFGSYPNAGGGDPFDLGKYLPKDMSKLLGPIGQIAGGYMQKKTGQQNEAQRQADWQRALLASRPNQTTPFGSVEWIQDPKTGAWTQSSKLSPEMQQRLEIYNQIAKDRLTNAAGMKLPKGGIDYGALGLSNIARAAGITEGQSPDARAAQPPYNPYADFAGGVLSPSYQKGYNRGFNPIFGGG